LVVVFGVGSFVLIWPQFYFSELALSMLPYGAAFFGLVSLVLLIVFFWNLTAKNAKTLRKGRKVFVFLLISLVLFGLYAFPLLKFYNISSTSETDASSQKVSFLFANILWTNNDYV